MKKDKEEIDKTPIEYSVVVKTSMSLTEDEHQNAIAQAPANPAAKTDAKPEEVDEGELVTAETYKFTFPRANYDVQKEKLERAIQPLEAIAKDKKLKLTNVQSKELARL